MLSEQQQRIMGYFIEEAKDHLNTIEQGLLNLQATIADSEMVNELFRAAHSVKGGAAMLGLTSIQNTSHRLEDYFKVLKECPIKIDQKLETLLLRVYDTLQELLEQLQGPFGLTDDKAEEAMAAVEPTFAELNQHLAQLVSQSGAKTPEDVDLAVVTPVSAVAARPSPARATTEESALRFIFQNDVPARLREMLQLFKQADTPETRQQLQALCQTLAQPGEQLDLSDWCQLLDTAERAIGNLDNTYRSLAPVIIKEIKRAQEQILTGNLAQVTASADLLALVPPEPVLVIADVTDTDLADLLSATDEAGDQFDLFSEEIASGESTTSETLSDDALDADLSSPSPELPFDSSESELELTFDALTAEGTDDSDALDLSFIDQFDEAIPALSNQQAGPEVGVAELNSLADLFEGEEPDLGFAWQEEVLDESVETEPEALELDESSNDFSDLLFQDSEALELDESEEDLSGLLNKSAQQAEAESPNPEAAFTFGEPAPDATLDAVTDFDQALFSEQPVDQTSAAMELDEAALFNSPDSALDMLFSEATPAPESDDLLDDMTFDALFVDGAVDEAESSADSGSAAEFDLAELGSFAGGLEDATPELVLDSELDGLGLLDVDLSLDDVLDDADEPPTLDQPEFQAGVSPESADSLESDLAALSPSPEADLGFWQPETVADPWSEESSQGDAALNEADEIDLFGLEADLADPSTEPSSATSWMDLELSESVNSLDELNAVTLETGSSEALDIEFPDNELDSAELNFQTLDDSTLEVLNQPSLELTADEAADLDFNFDQTAFDSSINSSVNDSEAELAFDLLADDAESLDLTFDPLTPAPDEATESVEEEVVFHFGTSADSTDADSELGLEDLTGDLADDDANDLELDLFAETESEVIVTSTADVIDLDDAFADLSLTRDEDLTAGLDSLSDSLGVADLSVEAGDLDDADLEDAEIEALLLGDSEADLTAESGLSELAELDDLNLDEFALPDDFSEMDSTSSAASAIDAEESADDLSSLFPVEMPVETADPPLEAAASDGEIDALMEFASDAEPPAPENPFANRTLEALFEADEELESPALDLDSLDHSFDQSAMELAAEITPHFESGEIDLADQTVDMRLFDPELPSDPLSAPEVPSPEPTDSDLDLTDLAELDFDLFAAEGEETSESTSELDLEPSLDSFDLDAELAVSDNPMTELDSDLESLSFETFETDDFGSADATTEQLLDASFNVDGIEAENLLEFAPDNRTDSVLEDDLTEGFASIAEPGIAEPTMPLEVTPDLEPSVEPAAEELNIDELGAEFPGDLSLDFELASPEVEPTEASADLPGENSDLALDFSDLEAASSSDDFDFETSLSDTSLSDADLSMDALFSSEISEAELSFESGFDQADSATAADEAELDFDLSLPDLEPDLETDLLEIESPTEAADLAAIDLNTGDLADLNTDDLTIINLDSDLESEPESELERELGSEFDSILDGESGISFSELEAADLDMTADASERSMAESDLNDLDFGELFEVDSLPESLPESLREDLAPIELEPEPSEASLGEAEFDDLDALLEEESLAATDAVFAEPAGFDDLEAMLAEEPSSITAIHLEDEETETTASETLNQTEDALGDDFSDLEALLDDTEPEPTEFAVPVSSLPIEVEDEFSDLEALLQDADQTLGVGSSPTRKASTTTNRRPSRRGGLNEQTMRVTVKHLDNLNNLVGEMVVNRNSLEQAQERLRQFLDNLLYQVQQLSDVGQRMRDLYERSLLESSLLSGRRGSMGASISGFGSGQSNHAAGMSFDALEMDRFTGFHVLSQEMIELIVRVRESASDIDFVVEETDQVTRNFRQITTQLQEGLTRSRMVPFSQTADRLPRGVRDNSLKYGKQAELIIEGRDTLIDKMIVEQLYDPMTHLVNNAVAHGIETPEERIAAGKSPTGQIVIRTFHQGNQTVISVSDDGAGINPEKVRAKALAKGLINATQAQEMSRLDTYDLLFHHGFSTADQIDDLRGRGVGLDVVRNNLNEIRGTISIDSTVGKGTTFTIRLPLTLSISKALCCISNRARIAFPMDGVEDMLDVPKERIQTDEQGQPCIQWRDTVLPFQPLSDLLRYNRVLGRGSVYGGNQEEDVISIVVLRSAGNFLALQVDQVLGEQEIVIKQLEGPVPKPLGVAGATVLGDGRIMPIADVLELIDLWQGRIRRESGGLLWDKGEAQLPPEPAKTESTVLIVDDSITVRELLSMTFNKVGYRVEQARDGQEAWEKLRAGLPCDLVFCDIEMPRMDGLELLSRIQKDSNLNHLPIAMLTSRGADRHRQMAVQLGAKGYFTKPYLEEVLLDAAQRMLKGEVMIPGVNTQ